MTREEALKIWDESVGFNEIECSHELQEAISTAFKELRRDPKEITFDDVQRYCAPRCLIIITNELFFKLTHTKGN